MAPSLSDGKTAAQPRLTRRIPLARIAFALVLLNLLWRTVRYALAFPIWGDEAFLAMNFLLRDAAGMLEPLEYGQIAPLLFMWAELAVVRGFGISELALRLLPFLCGIASMLVFWRFAGRILDRRSALLAVAIFAASYYPVRHATEIKPYSSDLLVSLVLSFSAWSVIHQPRILRRWLFLTVAATVGIWLSYPSAFVAGGVGLALLAMLVRERNVRLSGLWLAYALCVGVSFLVMLAVYAGPHTEAGWRPGESHTLDEWGKGFPPIREPWNLPLWLVTVHTGNLTAYPIGGKYGGSTATFLLVLIGIGVMWRERRMLLGLMLSPVPFAIVAAGLQRYPYGGSARFCLYLAPAFCILAGAGLSAGIKAVRPPRSAARGIRWAAVAMMLVAVGGIALGLIKPYRTVPDRENRKVLRWLARQTEPNDQWVAFNVPQRDPPRGDDIFLRGGHGARHRLYLHKLATVPLSWAPPVEEVVESARGRTWLIVYKDDRAPFPKDRLEQYAHSLAQSLGSPQCHEFDLGMNQAIVIYTFPAHR